MTRNSRLLITAVGLLLLDSPAAGGEAEVGEWLLWEQSGAIHLHAQAAPRADLIRAIGKRFGLTVVEHAQLTGEVTVTVENGSLHDVVSHVLRDAFSFQLYTSASTATDEVIPSTLWILPSGSARPDAAVAVFEAVLYDGSRSQKIGAIEALSSIATPAATHTLGVALSDDDAQVREAALIALEEDGGSEALSAIASAAASPAVAVRARAAEALASGGSDAALRYLLLALGDDDPRVRLAVIDSVADLPLGSVPSTAAMDLLEFALNDVELDVRLQALDALELLGGGAAYQALREQQERQQLAPEGPWRESGRAGRQALE